MLGAATLGRSLLRTATATVVMTTVVAVIVAVLAGAGAGAGELLGALALVAAGGVGGLAVFLATSALVRSEELRAAVAWLSAIGAEGGESGNCA